MNEKEIRCLCKVSERWYNALGKQIAEDELSDIFSITYDVTVESKLHSFQYMILQRALVTNEKLFKWKIKDTNCCQICHQDVETIEHLFYECEIVKKLWLDTWNTLHSALGAVPTDREGILLGKIYKDKHELINHIVLIVKRYIYKKRCWEENVSPRGVLYDIKAYCETEKQIAWEKRDPAVYDKYEKKWRVVEGILKEVLVDKTMYNNV